jgi:2-polyprenyl-6-methoxyphenol hydroxylase-like FAD-dependent oxidoreductase
VDERDGPTPVTESRALGVWERTQEVFADLGVIDAAHAHGTKIHALNVYSGGRRIVHVGLDLEGEDTAYPFVLSLPQGQTERILTGRLAELGVTVERDTKLTKLQQDASGVTATLVGPGGERTIRAAWLVGCDGAHSAVRHQLGLPFEGAAYEETFRLADARIDWELPHDEAHLTLTQTGGGVAAFPLPGENWWRLVDLTDGEAGNDAARIINRFRELLHANGRPNAAVGEPGWTSAFRLQRRMVNRFRSGRCFVAGDAAHIHSPAGGQGMNTGIQDAHNLAWKLALVVAGKSPESLLDSFDAERHPVARDVLRGTDLATRMVTLRQPLARSARNTAASFLGQFDFVRRRIARGLSELDIDYRRSPIVADDSGWFHSAGPRPGERAPDVVIRTDAEDCPVRLSSVLDRGRHTLLAFAGKSASGAQALETVGKLVGERYADRIAACLVVGASANLSWTGPRLDDAEGHLHHRYGADAATLYLIRPDGYIGYRAQPPDADKLAAYLGRLFC